MKMRVHSLEKKNFPKKVSFRGKSRKSPVSSRFHLSHFYFSATMPCCCCQVACGKMCQLVNRQVTSHFSPISIFKNIILLSSMDSFQILSFVFLLFIPPQIAPLGSHLEVIRLITGHYHSDQSSDSLGLLLRLLLSFGLFILECKFLWPLPEPKKSAKLHRNISSLRHFSRCGP